MRARSLTGVAMAFLVLVFATLGTSSSTGAATSRVTTYYVSVGDSYAAGYQPIARALHGKDRNGFAYQVLGLARRKGDDFILRNFACDGATTATVIEQKGCGLTSPGPYSVHYAGQTQAAAADGFIAAHRGHVGLISVSLSGNDILGCTSASIIVPCVTSALTTIRTNMATLLTGLRQAAGPTVPIVGITYPDVFLGLYPSKDAAQHNLAVQSVPVFRNLLNPALQALYSAVDASFVDVTAATGAYTPLSQTTTSSRYGTIPIAVAHVCTLTYYCQLQDVHPKTQGYAVIARLIVGSLPGHHIRTGS
jgi:lysophospholipase L1-like esterase